MGERKPYETPKLYKGEPLFRRERLADDWWNLTIVRPHHVFELRSYKDFIDIDSTTMEPGVYAIVRLGDLDE